MVHGTFCIIMKSRTARRLLINSPFSWVFVFARDDGGTPNGMSSMSFAIFHASANVLMCSIHKMMYRSHIAHGNHWHMRFQVRIWFYFIAPSFLSAGTPFGIFFILFYFFCSEMSLPIFLWHIVDDVHTHIYILIMLIVY